MNHKLVTPLIALLVGILVVGCSGRGIGGESVAKVDGQAISRVDLDDRTKIYALFFNQPMNSPGSKQQLLDQMVNDKLLQEQSERLHVDVTDAQIQAEMAKFISALDLQYKSHDESIKKVQEAGLTNDKIAGFIRDFLISQEVMEKKKAEAQVSDDEIRAFYEQNKETLYTFREPSVRAAHVLLSPDQEAKAREIAAKAKNGGNFAELAKEYSIDPGSARLGGDLGYFTRGTMVKEFSDAAFSLKPGEVSDPVKSQFGWHVIMVIDRRGPGVVPFEAARDDAAHRVLPQKQDQVFNQWLRDLQKAAKIDKAALS